MAAGPPLKCGRLPIPFVNGDCRNSHVRDDSLETDGIAAADHKPLPEEEDIARAGFTWCLSLPRREKELSSFHLKVHKIENFFGSEFEFYTISLLVMLVVVQLRFRDSVQ